MLFKLAIAIFVSIQVPTHGHGLVRRVTADDKSIVEPNAADPKPKLKSGKAEKGKHDDEDDGEEPLSMFDIDVSASNTTGVTSSFVTPEPRSVSVENMKRSKNDVWNHGATSISSTNGGTIKFDAPKDTQVGDTLFLFLSRSDGYLPLHIDQWKRGTECFKSFNKQDVCMRASHCVKRDGPYCLQFDNESGGGDGKDLATVVFYRHVEEEDPGCWTLELRGKTTVWAIVAAIPHVNKVQPIFRTNGTSCDASWASVFPSVYGKKDDVLLLSQSFDDTAMKRQFQPPEGTDLLGFTNSFDEAGFLFGMRFKETGSTGELVTGGRGGPKCKDALVSLVVNKE